MKYLFIFIPLFSFAQSQDSIVYEKRDSVWFRVTYVKETQPLGDRSVRIDDPYTTVDSLVALALRNEVIQASQQYAKWRERKEREEKDYLLRIRQAEKVYKDITGKRVDVDSLSNAKQLLGTWLYDREELTITKQLKIKTLTVNFVSEKVFWMNIDGHREYFFKKGNDWISENHKLIYIKKVKNK